MSITTKIQAIFDSISDDDLRAAVRELRELEECGVLPSGVVRDLRARLVEVGVPENDAGKVVDSIIYRMAAFKWAGV